MLFAMLLVILIPVFLLGVLSPLFYAKTVEDLTTSASLEMIWQVNRNLDQLFLQWEQLMVLTAQVPPVSDFLNAATPSSTSDVRGYLSALKTSHPEVTGMVILNSRGQSRFLDFTQVTRDPLLWEPWARLDLSPMAIRIRLTDRRTF